MKKIYSLSRALALLILVSLPVHLQSFTNTDFHSFCSFTFDQERMNDNPRIKNAIGLIEAKLLGFDLKDQTTEAQGLFDMRDYLKQNLENKNASSTLFDALVFAVSKNKERFGEFNSGLIAFLSSYYSQLTRQVHDIQLLKPKGTGLTTGHIAELFVINDSDVHFRIEPQLFYIPSDGKYQSYVAEIPEGISLPPNRQTTIPIIGYCADAHVPPVPAGADMPPFEEWIPVLEFPNDNILISKVPAPEPMNPPGASTAPQVPEPMNPPGASTAPQVPEPMNPPGASTAPQVPEPMNPPGASTAPQVPEPMNPPGASTAPQVPEPMNPPGASTAPQVPEPMNPPQGNAEPQVPEPMNPPGGSSGTGKENLIPPAEPLILLSNRVPLPPFDPLQVDGEDDPEIEITTNNNELIPTWPGTTIIIRETPNLTSPEELAPIIVEAIKQIKDATVIIQEDPNFITPFSADPEKEREAIIQQTFWIYTSLITGKNYDKSDFEKNVHEQFEAATGTTYEELDENGKANIDEGTISFWNSYTATGVEAKVLSASSTGLDVDNPGMSDILASVKVPKCKCDSITYTLEVKQEGVVIHSEAHNSRKSPTIKVEDLEYGDNFEIKISSISAHCNCGDSVCPFYAPQSPSKSRTGFTKTDLTKPGKVEITMSDEGSEAASENCNCQNKDKSWNEGEYEYSFKLETKNERSNETAIFQRLTIRAYCELEDCIRGLCKKTIQLNFVKK